MELSMRDRDGKVGQRPQYICKSTLFGTALLISFGEPSSYEVSLPNWNYCNSYQIPSYQIPIDPNAMPPKYSARLAYSPMIVWERKEGTIDWDH